MNSGTAWMIADSGIRGMSALGQERTFRDVSGMSALPPITDIRLMRRHGLKSANNRHVIASFVTLVVCT
jgi:hypothetical protein